MLVPVLVRAELGLVQPSRLNQYYLNQFPIKSHPTALAFPDPLKVRVEQLGVVLVQVVPVAPQGPAVK